MPAMTGSRSPTSSVVASRTWCCSSTLRACTSDEWPFTVRAERPGTLTTSRRCLRYEASSRLKSSWNGRSTAGITPCGTNPSNRRIVVPPSAGPPRASLPPGKAGLPLLEERGHPFDAVLGLEGPVEELPLEGESARERQLEGRKHGRLGETRRDRRLLGDRRGDLEGALERPVGRQDLGDQAGVARRPRVDRLAGQDEPHGQRLADRPGE